jgi:transcriptional regulator with XRE-family HTH domain
MKNPMPFSERIKTLREDHGWSQEDLSHKTGISEAILGELETQPEVHVDSGMHLVFANVFERSVLEIVKGTSIEEFLSDSFMPKFCINHEEIIVFPSEEDGIENKFCSDCGEKLKGQCESCGAPISTLWGGEGQYCGICGNEIHLNLENVDYSSLESVFFEREDFTRREFMSIRDYSFRPALSICPSIQKHMMEDQNYPAPYHYDVQTIRYHYNGRIDFCPTCGQKKYTHCPQCNRLLIGSSLGLLKFCPGCAY